MIRREAGKWANALRKTDWVRSERPGQVLGVVHADFHADPAGVVDRIYDFIGMDRTPALRAAMDARSEAKSELAHGVHRYGLADFGISAAEVREPFGDYVGRYGLLKERWGG
jgi:hypothetical protein